MKKGSLKYKNAKNLKGYIIHTEGEYFLRVKSPNDSFKDYQLVHPDLEIQILDDDAEIVEADDGSVMYIDCSRKTLGIEND